jgi:MoaA/NifB/PqqE/SkfB family radical SAM enzyme
MGFSMIGRRGLKLVERVREAYARDARVMKKDLAFSAVLLKKKPFHCLVQVTNRCNMQCSFCDFWPNAAPKQEELTSAEFWRISDELSELGCFLISIEGGEPFIRPDLKDIVYAFSRHHIPALYTNGWYVTKENASALWDAGLVHATVSIDYPDKARHDDKRRLVGTYDRAWKAIETFRDTAPRGGKQVHVMTVLMESNWQDMDELFAKSAAYGVGHQVTLLSTQGYRRGKSSGNDGAPVDRPPPPDAAESMTRLWDKHTHVRFFREYFERMGSFLSGGAMPTCRAGLQSLNIDHVGNVSPCIEKIDDMVGNVREQSLASLHSRLVAKNDEVSACQRCWTSCRGFNQAMGDGGTLTNWAALASRMTTT